jgi:hypothetical protein
MVAGQNDPVPPPVGRAGLSRLSSPAAGIGLYDGKCSALHGLAANADLYQIACVSL